MAYIGLYVNYKEKGTFEKRWRAQAPFPVYTRTCAFIKLLNIYIYYAICAQTHKEIIFSFKTFSWVLNFINLSPSI